MERKVLLYWISMILMLMVRGETVNEEDKELYAKLCEKCLSNEYPDCATLDVEIYNKTIYCEQTNEEYPCTFGIVQPAQGGNEQNIFCRINNKQQMNLSAENAVDKTPAASVLWSTMKPIPLVLKTTTSESIQYENIPVNNEHEAIEIHPMQELNMESTTEPALLMAQQTTTISEPHSAEGNVLSVPEVPAESADYQGDSPEGVAHVAEVTAPPEIIQTTQASVTSKAPESSIESESINMSGVALTTEIAETEKETEKADIAQVTATASNTKSELHESSTAVNIPEVASESDSLLPKEPEPVMPQVANNNTNALQQCYGCESTTDTSCRETPNKEINCRAEHKAKNGCYAVLKVDSNITTRGCLSDLTQEGLNYCKKHTKQCVLCHEPNCNKQALSAATGLHCRAALLVICFVLAITFARKNKI